MEKISVQLGNRKATFIRPFPWESFNEILKYRKPGWEYSPGGKAYLKNKAAGIVDDNGKIPGWDGYIHLLKYDAVGCGIFLALRKTLEEEANVKFIVEDYRKTPKLEIYDLPEKARGYQQQCFVEMFAASKTGGLILQATGSGKTFAAGLYFKALQGAGVFFVDELTLLDQAQKELEKVIGEEVGNIGNQKFNPKRITVATIQTVHRHRFDKGFIPWIRTIQAMFIDEIHVALNRRNFQTVAAIKPPVIFGLTATLELKKKHVAYRAYDLAGPVVFEYPLEMGVKEGFLSNGIAIAVQVSNVIAKEPFDGKGGWRRRMQWYRQRYPEEYRSIIVESQKRNDVIRELILEAREKGKYIIVLLERVQHLKDLSNSLDIPHDLVFGEKRVSQRIESKRRFEAGNIRVILTNKIFKKGIDIKRVDVIIDGAAMKSRNDSIQKYGRGVRLCDEKDGLIYLDISDVDNRFEKAAKSRRLALKSVGVQVFKADSEMGAQRILELAEEKLLQLVRKKIEPANAG